MSRAPKIKIVAARMLAPKASRTIATAAHRTFPAWIDATERDGAVNVRAVMPRVRDGLVLRMVRRAKPALQPKKSAHGPGAR